jgi:hypothetical protein
MKKYSLVFILVFVTVSLTGCGFGDVSRKLDVPVTDRVLTYDLPMDLAYLRTLEALEKVPDWELEQTEKEKGWVRVRNVNFSRFDDADKRLITVQLLSGERGKTSVQLAAASQRVLGGDVVLAQIEKYLDAEVARRAVVSAGSA